MPRCCSSALSAPSLETRTDPALQGGPRHQAPLWAILRHYGIVSRKTASGFKIDCEKETGWAYYQSTFNREVSVLPLDKHLLWQCGNEQSKNGVFSKMGQQMRFSLLTYVKFIRNHIPPMMEEFLRNSLSSFPNEKNISGAKKLLQGQHYVPSLIVNIHNTNYLP